MAIPNDIDRTAVQLLINADWPWDDSRKAFVEARRPDAVSSAEYKHRTPRSIGYGELRDHGLAGAISQARRDNGLAWLRSALGLNE